MSMTLDDLEKTFFDAFSGEIKALNLETIEPGDTRLTRAGIRAVVKALAPDDDEIAAYNRLSYKVREQLKCECDYLPEDKCIRCSVMEALKCLETRFNEILGDAGNEKAAGGRGTECPVASGSSLGQTPAADPSPEVCEWTFDNGQELFDDSFDAACGGKWMSIHNNPKQDGYNFCPSCGKPIAFKEPTP